MSDLINKITVECDEPGCGFAADTTLESIREWHKKPCPQCGRGVIIDDCDLAMLDSMLQACNALGSIGVVGGDGSCSVSVRIDSAKVKRGAVGEVSKSCDEPRDQTEEA